MRCLTDASVREETEKYLADRFPAIAMFSASPVVTNETLSPDLQNPDALLYEWIPKDAQTVSGAGVAGNRTRRSPATRVARSIWLRMSRGCRHRRWGHERGHLDAIIVPHQGRRLFFNPPSSWPHFSARSLSSCPANKQKLSKWHSGSRKQQAERPDRRDPRAWTHPQFPSRTQPSFKGRAQSTRAT